jgi:hypothetical protein
MISKKWSVISFDIKNDQVLHHCSFLNFILLIFLSFFFLFVITDIQFFLKFLQTNAIKCL